MKLILFILFLPLAIYSQSNKLPGQSKVYAKLDGGIMFGKDQHKNAAGFLSIGGRAGQYVLVGLSSGLFKPAGFSHFVTAIGAETSVTNLKARISPVARAGVYYPITSESFVTGKYYFSAGGGVSMHNARGQGAMLTVNFGQLKYNFKSYFLDEDATKSMIYVSLGFLL